MSSSQCKESQPRSPVGHAEIYLIKHASSTSSPQCMDRSIIIQSTNSAHKLQLVPMTIRSTYCNDLSHITYLILSIVFCKASPLKDQFQCFSLLIYYLLIQQQPWLNVPLVVFARNPSSTLHISKPLVIKTQNQ